MFWLESASSLPCGCGKQPQNGVLCRWRVRLCTWKVSCVLRTSLKRCTSEHLGFLGVGQEKLVAEVYPAVDQRLRATKLQTPVFSVDERVSWFPAAGLYFPRPSLAFRCYQPPSAWTLSLELWVPVLPIFHFQDGTGLVRVGESDKFLAQVAVRKWSRQVMHFSLKHLRWPTSWNLSLFRTKWWTFSYWRSREQVLQGFPIGVGGPLLRNLLASILDWVIQSPRIVQISQFWGKKGTWPILKHLFSVLPEKLTISVGSPVPPYYGSFVLFCSLFINQW